MSMMKTLARVAAGVMLAKGIGSVMKSAQQGGSGTATAGRSQGGLLDDLIGGVTGRQSGRATGSGGGLGDILGQVLGGQTGGAGTGRRYGGPNSSGASGGLGGILDQLTSQARGGATARGSSGGGLGDLLGGLLGGAAGGLAQKGAQQQNDASFGELFNDAVVRQDEPEVAPTPEQNAVAALMLRAMIQAAKADGKIDDNEKQRLTGQLGDIDDEERQFIREQMAAPVDAAALAREVPKGLEAQVYAMSLMAIDFDSKAEAEYLHALAQGMGLSRDQVNNIHQQIGVQNLYA
ncbi:MAG: DUF533 domain-containing protein [Paracoccus sp. (in: a-proteobacteria)]|uniref:DUF533 domain-containing protein n=1 Tax=Paracoccus sp. TaxID=267 RepID=UPI0026DFA404|nr:DUF533 domain-containing protein [Paracoccus sp. (in: a-proteobacteria)]MDO5633237.1 DUF533 domain-containing protein [Paracoccus sp. (in: a-proteobacteria)]